MPGPDNVQRLIDHLQASDAVRDASLYWSESRRMSLGIKDGATGSPHAPRGIAESGGARYLLVWRDGRVSRGYLERRQVLGDPAVTLAHTLLSAYEDPDAAQVGTPGAPIPQVELHDDRAAALAAGETSPVARRLAEVRRNVRQHRLRTWSGSFSAGESTARLWTSRGLNLRARGSSIGWFVSFNGEVGTGFGARAPETDEDFRGRLERLVELAKLLDGAGRAPAGGDRPVLLHPRVVENYVLSTLLHHLDGATVHHGEGHFRQDRFGAPEPVLREDLSLTLDPLEPLRSGSYRFSMEGVPASRTSLIERGRLVQPILDLKYARRLERAPTALPLAMDVLHLDGPARISWEQALAAADGGALILSVLGVHTQDSTSGDFSLSAPQSLAIRKGCLDGRIRLTLSGNLFSILNDRQLALVSVAGEHTPGLLIHCRIDST